MVNNEEKLPQPIRQEVHGDWLCDIYEDGSVFPRAYPYSKLAELIRKGVTFDTDASLV